MWLKAVWNNTLSTMKPYIVQIALVDGAGVELVKSDILDAINVSEGLRQ